MSLTLSSVGLISRQTRSQLIGGGGRVMVNDVQVVPAMAAATSLLVGLPPLTLLARLLVARRSPTE